MSEKGLLQKVAPGKIFEYSPLGNKLNTQIDIANKQHQKLDKMFEFDKIIMREIPAFKKYNRSNLIDNGKYKY